MTPTVDSARSDAFDRAGPSPDVAGDRPSLATAIVIAFAITFAFAALLVLAPLMELALLIATVLHSANADPK